VLVYRRGRGRGRGHTVVAHCGHDKSGALPRARPRFALAPGRAAPCPRSAAGVGAGGGLGRGARAPEAGRRLAWSWAAGCGPRPFGLSVSSRASVS
jgi:hypothetical protein